MTSYNIGAKTYLTPALLAANGDTVSSLTEQAPYSNTALGDAATTTYDQYYANWLNYESKYYTYFYSKITNGVTSTKYNVNGFTPLTTTKANGASTSAVTAASYLITAQNTLASDSNFTTAAQYATYLSAYTAYSTRYSNWAASITKTQGIATLITSLLPPPEISVSYIIPVFTVPSFVVANSPNVMPTASNQAAIAGMALDAETFSSHRRQRHPRWA
jgi:hypothetical protein